MNFTKKVPKNLRINVGYTNLKFLTPSLPMNQLKKQLLALQA